MRGGGRLPDWWRTKPDQLPDADDEPAPRPAPGPAPGWWDHLYADDQTDRTDEAEEVAEDAGPDTVETTSGSWWTPQPDYYPHLHVPTFVSDQQARPAVSPQTRAILYNAAAAGTGWVFGLYGQFATALDDCGQHSIGGALTLGVGGCLVIAHLWDRRTRHWRVGLDWVARIPLATAILALALWAPASS
ncbi:hypothetical protein [Streptomyces sp. NPDC017941]|uniref:hypothetical protein n=1 Tax=Streptomyces sp. NPDC017941 TaxID=3365018 RepID=UPI0037B7FD69